MTGYRGRHRTRRRSSRLPRHAVSTAAATVCAVAAVGAATSTPAVSDPVGEAGATFAAGTVGDALAVEPVGATLAVEPIGEPVAGTEPSAAPAARRERARADLAAREQAARELAERRRKQAERRAAQREKERRERAQAAEQAARAAERRALQQSPQAVAALLAERDYGWGARQFGCLDSLWISESAWHWYATNRSSGAYGIPQSLPGRKMAQFGADWRTNPVTQIRWGLWYVQQAYGTPCSAWSFKQAHNWY